MAADVNSNLANWSTTAASNQPSGDPEITDGKPGITGYYYARSGWKWEIRMVYKTFPGRCFEGRWGWKMLNKRVGDKCTFVSRQNPFKKFG